MSKKKNMKSESSQDWAFWNKKAKKQRQRNNELRTPEILQWAFHNKVNANRYSPYVIRLTKQQLIVDIYPMTGKWHNITLNERGQASDVMLFLEKTFYILNQPKIRNADPKAGIL